MKKAGKKIPSNTFPEGYIQGGGIPISGVTGYSSEHFFPPMGPTGTNYYAGNNLYSDSDDIPELIREWDKAIKDVPDDVRKSETWKRLETERMKHLTWRFSYPKQVFTQQYIISWVIFVLVILLVLVGLVFSFYQLNYAIRLGNVSSLQTEIAIETAGRLSISSSIVGIFVLFVSVAFFYLFIKHVFGVRQLIPPLITLRAPDANKRSDKEEIEPENGE